MEEKKKNWLVVETYESHDDRETAEHRCYILNTVFPQKEFYVTEKPDSKVDTKKKNDTVEKFEEDVILFGV